MTDAEIKKLAHDLVTNQIFMSDQCRRPEEVSMVFMPLLFLDAAALETLKKDDIVHFYEYNAKALPRGINGMPMFSSMHCISRQDYDKLLVVEKQMRVALGEISETPEPCEYCKADGSDRETATAERLALGLPAFGACCEWSKQKSS
jgi:hypothetical protein